MLWQYRADVRTTEGRRAFVDAIATTGGLDILVNNVGNERRGPTTELDEGDYRAVLETNLDAAVFLCRDCKAMLEERNGCVVNIGSISGVCCDHTGVAYAVSKAGLDHLTRYLACEWGPCQVRVNSVDPWFIRTELTEPLLDDSDFRAAVEARTPLRRVTSRPTSAKPSPATLFGALCDRTNIVCGRGPDLQRVRIPEAPPRQTERTILPGAWVILTSLSRHYYWWIGRSAVASSSRA